MLELDEGSGDIVAADRVQRNGPAEETEPAGLVRIVDECAFKSGERLSASPVRNMVHA